MARYRWAANGAAYGAPHGLIKTVLKARETCIRDGGGFRLRAPGRTYSDVIHSRLRFLGRLTRVLRAMAVGDMTKIATACEGSHDLGHVYMVRRAVVAKHEPLYPSGPVFVGMPSNPSKYVVGTGMIFCGGECKDDYDNIEQATVLGQSVKLQHPAMDSYIAAANEVGGIPLTGSWRSCQAQAAFYASDMSRYAPPSKTAHTRGLAIDVSTAQSADKLKKVHAALSKRGWFQARADEPWHWSYGIRT